MLNLLNSSPKRQGLDVSGDTRTHHRAKQRGEGAQEFCAQLLCKWTWLRERDPALQAAPGPRQSVNYTHSSLPWTHCQASSQGSTLSSQISLGFLATLLSWKAFPLCCRSYLPACFPLGKRLALIHLHKHRGSLDPSEPWPLHSWKGDPSAKPGQGLVESYLPSQGASVSSSFKWG